MKNLHNVEPSGFHKGEYVGYGLGKVWRIRKTQFGGWKWAAHVPQEPAVATRYADTLESMSSQIEKTS